MIGVGESIVDDLPSFFLIDMLLVNQDTEQLNDTQSWMSIIKLNTSLFGEILPFEFSARFFGVGLMASNDILNGCRNEKILLLQPQLFTCFS